MSHNPSSTLSTTTSNASTASNSSSGGGCAANTSVQNSFLTVNTHRSHYDFKTRRSSSEPVHEQVFLQSASVSGDASSKVLTPTASKDTTSTSNNASKDNLLIEDEIITKDDGFIDCLQNMTNINKVSQIKNKIIQLLFELTSLSKFLLHMLLYTLCIFKLLKK